MALEIQLINEIEKYEFLYNYNLAAYNRKDIIERAWGEISETLNLTANECKEKWRNIRSSFLRSMKQTGRKIKKPYYLREYLNFIVPFLKPLHTADGGDDVEMLPNGGTSDDIMLDFIKVEPDMTGYIHDESVENNSDSVSLSDLLANKSQVTVSKKRKKLVPVGKRYKELNKNRKRIGKVLENDTLGTNNATESGNNALRMFLLSLLPELEPMTQSQVRLFKIKTLTLIDEIRTNSTTVKNSSSLNSDRLQKRLINLLLKNLENNTKQNTDES